MFKKILLVLFLIAAFGSASLIQAQSRERLPKLPTHFSKNELLYPMYLLKNTSVKGRLRKLLGRNYASFMEAIDTQSPLEQRGDLLIGSGCAKGLCTILEAMFVIDLSTKTIHCAIVNTSDKQKYQKFSESPANFPPVITGWANNLLKDKE